MLAVDDRSRRRAFRAADVITNDAEVLRAFAAETAGPVVCKTFSSLMLSDGEKAGLPIAAALADLLSTGVSP